MPHPTDFIAIPGSGVTAIVEGHAVEVRRDAEAACAVTVDGTLIGRIDVQDQPLHDASAAISSLHELGVSAHMLSGDRLDAALDIAGRIGIDPEHVRAGVTPEEIEATFNFVDDDNSGTLSRDEFEQYMDQYVGEVNVLDV